MNKKLIFIYNAKSDTVSGIKDSIQKIKTGKSECSLCTATWTAFNVKPSWSEKEKRIKIPFVYYHRDDMPEKVENFLEENNISLPTVLLGEDGKFSELVSKENLDKCEGNDDCVWNLLKSSSPEVS
ncbi:hypothetical protein IID23_02320 [Patescibacteria group bacterium]|nr:hypothetical protein [Patescibacteria group bacterium]